VGNQAIHLDPKFNFRRPRTITRVALIVTLGTWIGACGGGGGGGGSSPPPGPSVTGSGSAPSTGPGDTMAYFPLAAGNQWLYNSTDSSTNTPSLIFDVTAAVNGTKTVQGQSATIVTRTNSPTPVDQYYASSAGGITYFGTSDPADTITPLLIPYPQMLFPVSTGTVSSITGKNLAFGKDAAGNAITLNLTQTIVNAGLETVSVPAGTFANAMKQVTTVSGTALDGSQSIPVSGTDTVWFAPGVGQVKEISVANASGTSITNTFDLKGFVVNGQPHGFGPPKVLTASSTNLADFIAAVASDGTNFLLVTHHGPADGSAMNWVGTLLAPDGTLIKTFNITPSVSPVAATTQVAVAAFDGSNYLVVYVPDLNPGGQPDTLAAVRISPTGAILGTPVTVVPAIAAGSSFAIAFDRTPTARNYSVNTLLQVPACRLGRLSRSHRLAERRPRLPSLSMGPTIWRCGRNCNPPHPWDSTPLECRPREASWTPRRYGSLTHLRSPVISCHKRGRASRLMERIIL